MANNSMTKAHLRFDGSVWVNMDIALRRLDQVIGRIIAPLNLTVIEWYILRALYEQDGQHASELARAVGRAATSFTPNLDKLQARGLIERKPDPSDRRAVHIYLTSAGERLRSTVQRMSSELDDVFRSRFEPEELEGFLAVLADLQNFDEVDTR